MASDKTHETCSDSGQTLPVSSPGSVWPDDYDAETVAMSGGTGLPAVQWAMRQRGECGDMSVAANGEAFVFCHLKAGHAGNHQDGLEEWGDQLR